MEFQRTFDKTIAQYIIIYKETTETNIIKSKTFSKIKGKDPPIISIVLYDENQNYAATVSKNELFILTKKLSSTIIVDEDFKVISLPALLAYKLIFCIDDELEFFNFIDVSSLLPENQ